MPIAKIMCRMSPSLKDQVHVASRLTGVSMNRFIISACEQMIRNVKETQPPLTFAEDERANKFQQVGA